ncbi:MAG: carbamoyl-phosphate synthase (glutamine-hydrolyzing) large subunit [archaeon]
MPKHDWIKKVLILGSGAIKIGEAAEFDYSGSQALKALREEGLETVLVNPNIATIQTDPKVADRVYLVPVTPEYVEKVIEKERPDSILLGFGGQTALNCGVKLAEKGILERYNVRVLGTPISAIVEADNRELFRQAMIRASVPIPKSGSASSCEQALLVADKIGYPVIVRVAYTLGGKGSGVAHNPDELRKIVDRALGHSMIGQVLVEEYLKHWKEIEYEVVRDGNNNCLTVCNMENFDPMGIHTGDSIVVAPSQTLNNREYQLLRTLSIKVIQSLGIVGECNIQWALDPKSEEIRAIEVNSRMSRSSALASKATGYPLAYVAAKLAVGYNLPELTNKVTKVTTACFEPALDYIVIKIPRWDFQKFRNIDPTLGPQMKSVGEVMAIGRTFEEALQKAVRMLDIGRIGLVCNSADPENRSIGDLRKNLARPTDTRLFQIVEALKKGLSIEEIYKITGIDPWFLNGIANIIEMEHNLRSSGIEENGFRDILIEAKKAGFSDSQVAECLKCDETRVRKLRKTLGIRPVTKQIDTLAAEWPANTNYLYLTYGGNEDDIHINSTRKVLVLGSGAFRIGSSVEFDWCAVKTIEALKREGIEEAIMINYNPETVSTDYDISDKLYFEELTLERILDIYENEKPLGIIVSVGGQTPNNLAKKLAKAGVKLLGADAESIDTAEDRSKFSNLLDRLRIPQPRWNRLADIKDAKQFADDIGYPVLVRPSYVLSGSAMRVAYDAEELEEYLQLATDFSAGNSVVISEFMEDAREVEVDAVTDGRDVLIGAVIEHIENAGVHSGDATMCIPAIDLPNETIATIKMHTNSIGKALKAATPFNVQYLVKDGEVYVIECNLRASRSMPYTSKTIGVNLIEAATSVIMGGSLKELDLHSPEHLPYVSVKAPQFSFMRLEGADTILGVEMMSTGEVACFGKDLSDALLMAYEAAEFTVTPNPGSVLITVGNANDKAKMIPIALRLGEAGFKIYATKGTADTLLKAGIPDVTVLYKIREGKEPNVMSYLLERKIGMVINIPSRKEHRRINGTRSDGYAVRRLSAEYNIPIVTTKELAEAITKALTNGGNRDGGIKALNDYMNDLKLSQEPQAIEIVGSET